MIKGKRCEVRGEKVSRGREVESGIVEFFCVELGGVVWVFLYF